MKRQDVSAAVNRELRRRTYTTPSFIVKEDAEPDTIRRGGYPFQIVFTSGQQFTVLDRPTDTRETFEASIVQKLSILFPEAPTKR